MSSAKPVEKLDLQIQQLKAQRALLLASEKTALRRRRNRMCYIIGGFIMARKPELVEAIGQLMIRPHDRAVFGLPPREDVLQASSDRQIVDILLPLDDLITEPPAQVPQASPRTA